MKFIDIIFGSVKWLIAAMTTLIGGWLWLETHFDTKVQASENRVMDKVQIMRQGDLELIRSIKDDTRIIKEHLLRKN
jgi:hypothetical protein